jgi:hypothetical protein
MRADDVMNCEATIAVYEKLLQASEDRSYRGGELHLEWRRWCWPMKVCERTGTG